MDAKRQGSFIVGAVASVALAAALWIGMATPTLAQSVSPTCPAGYHYKAGTTICESVKSGSCNAPDDASACYRIQSGKCVLMDVRHSPSCHGGGVVPPVTQLPSSVPLVCPTGYQFRAASNDCYSSKPATCPAGYAISVPTGKCVKKAVPQ